MRDDRDFAPREQPVRLRNEQDDRGMELIVAIILVGIGVLLGFFWRVIWNLL